MPAWLISDGFVKKFQGMAVIAGRTNFAAPGIKGAFISNIAKGNVGDRLWIFDEKAQCVSSTTQVIATSVDFGTAFKGWSPNCLITGPLQPVQVPVSRQSLHAHDKEVEGIAKGYRLFYSNGRTRARPFCVGPLFPATVQWFEQTLAKQPVDGEM